MTIKEPLKLSSFDKQIDAKTAERAYNYWLSQAIADMTQVDETTWRAVVWASISYEVGVKIENDTITHWECSCPYDWGDMCKHTLAVLFAIRNRSLETNPQPIKTRKQEIIEILEKNKADDIQNFICEYAIKNKEFFLAFLAKFGKDYETDRLKQYYAKFIHENARIYTRDDDFIDRDEAFRFIKPIEKLLQKAEVYIKEKQYNLAIPICLSVIEELVGLLSDSDDSLGRIADAIENAFELVYGIVSTAQDSALCQKIVAYCQEEKLDIKYQNWGYQSYFERIIQVARQKYA